MSVLPVMSAKEVMRKLQRGGFLFTHAKGSHHFFHNIIKNRTTSVPLHGGNDIGIDEFNNL